MVPPSARLLTSDVQNTCQLQPWNPRGVRGKNDLLGSLCQEILLTGFTALELVDFAKKCSCDSQAEVVVGVSRPNLSSGSVRAGQRASRETWWPEPRSLAALTTLGALGWGMKSEKKLCAMFPSPSCPCCVWDLVL